MTVESPQPKESEVLVLLAIPLLWILGYRYENQESAINTYIDKHPQKPRNPYNPYSSAWLYTPRCTENITALELTIFGITRYKPEATTNPPHLQILPPNQSVYL